MHARAAAGREQLRSQAYSRAETKGVDFDDVMFGADEVCAADVDRRSQLKGRAIALRV